MKVNFLPTPRKFTTGKKQEISILDMGEIHLEPNEQITFKTDSGSEYDFCKKDWGYYATPSVNDRLKKFGFKTALIKNKLNKLYVMVVEVTKMELFQHYLQEEDLILVHWLDELFDKNTPEFCPICFAGTVETVKTYSSAPAGENNFNLKPYFRVLQQCNICKHCFNTHNYNFEDFYQDKYVDAVYRNNLQKQFDKIINLPANQSDNTHRVKRIIALMQQVRQNQLCNFKVLDIGTGLAVFPFKLKQETGWNCVALDPNIIQVNHARGCGIETIHASVMDYHSEEKYDLITLNKVLEHFEKPQAVLQKIKSFLHLDRPSYIYIEVPDGEEALKVSSEREEFFIEHFHAFSFSSIYRMLENLGFKLLTINRIIEPSGKFTFYSLAEVTSSY